MQTSKVVQFDSLAGWVHRGQKIDAGITYDVYANTEGYRALLFVPAVMREGFGGPLAAVVNLGYEGPSLLAMEGFQQRKHTKITVRNITYAEPEITLQAILDDPQTPKGDGRAKGQGAKQRWEEPVKQMSLNVPVSLSDELAELAKKLNTERSTAAVKAIRLVAALIDDVQRLADLIKEDRMADYEDADEENQALDRIGNVESSMIRTIMDHSDR